MRNDLRVRLLAAAIGLALGSTAAVAQPDRAEDRVQDTERSQDAGDRPESQRQDPEPRAESQEGISADQDDDTQASSREPSGSGEIDQLTDEHDDLSTFVDALKTTGLADSLTDGTQYTVFAPTNDALESMEEELQSDEGDREELTSLLRAHIVADDLDEEAAGTIGQAQTIDGGTLDLSMEGDELMVDEATVEDSPIELGSLRVYKIDSVLSRDAGAEGAGAEAPAVSREEGDAGQDRPAAGDRPVEPSEADEDQSRQDVAIDDNEREGEQEQQRR